MGEVKDSSNFVMSLGKPISRQINHQMRLKVAQNQDISNPTSKKGEKLLTSSFFGRFLCLSTQNNRLEKINRVTFLCFGDRRSLNSLKQGTNLWRTERGEKSYLFVDL